MTCPQCNNDFLEENIKEKNAIDGYAYCPSCNESFIYEKDIITHEIIIRKKHTKFFFIFDLFLLVTIITMGLFILFRFNIMIQFILFIPPIILIKVKTKFMRFLSLFSLLIFIFAFIQ
jgi:hypothetical protein